MNKAVFLDRDGVINRKARKGEYITRWEDMYFLPGVVESIASLREIGFLIIVITNQRCVATGLISILELEALHQRMRDELAKVGAGIDAIYYCPHEKQPICDCRKPAPGMLLNAMREHNIAAFPSWMIGDSDIDIEAGINAGCKTARILYDGEVVNKKADVTAKSLQEAIHQILQRDGVEHSDRNLK